MLHSQREDDQKHFQGLAHRCESGQVLMASMRLACIKSRILGCNCWSLFKGPEVPAHHGYSVSEDTLAIETMNE